MAALVVKKLALGAEQRIGRMAPSFDKYLNWMMAMVAVMCVAHKANASDPTVELPAFIVEETRIGPTYYFCELPGARVLTLTSRSETRAICEGAAEYLRLYSAMVPRDFWAVYSRPTLAMVKPLPNGLAQTVRGRIANAGTSHLGDLDTKCYYRVFGEPFRAGAATFKGMGYGIAQLHVWFPSDESLRLPQWVRVAIASFTGPRSRNEPTLSVSTKSARFYVPYRMFRPPEEWRSTSFSAAFRSDEAGFLTYDSPFLRHFSAWALLHPEHPERVEAFWNFVRVLANRAATEEDMRRCLGLSFEELKARMIEDWRRAKPQLRRDGETLQVVQPAEYTGGRSVTISLGAVPRIDPVVREATAAERVLIASEWSRLEADRLMKEATKRGEVPPTRAMDLLDAAIKRLERFADVSQRDPECVASLGMCRLARGDIEGAIPLLQEAATKNVRRGGVYWELANHRLAEERNKLRNGKRNMDDATAEEILGLLATCRGFEPPAPKVYALCFEVLEASSDAVLKNHAGVIAEFTERLPRQGGEAHAQVLRDRLAGLRK